MTAPTENTAKTATAAEAVAPELGPDDAILHWARAVLARLAVRADGAPAPVPACPAHPRLDHLAQVFTIGPAAHQTLALLYGLWLTPGPHPAITSGLAADALEVPRGMMRAPLVSWSLVHEVPQPPGAAVALSLDETIAEWLTGGPALPPVLRDRVSGRAPLPSFDEWPVKAAATFLQGALSAPDHITSDLGPDGPAVLEIEGPPGSGRRSFAAAVGAALGADPMIVDLSGLDTPDALAVVRAVERAAMLELCPIVWFGADGLSLPMAQPAFPVQMEVLTSSAAPIERTARARKRVTLGPLTMAARVIAWHAHLGPTWSKDDIAELASVPATVGEIAGIAAHRPTTKAEALEALRARHRTTLDATIRPQRPEIDWDDLVLPDRTLDALRRLEREMALGPSIFADPAMDRLFPQGRGVFALFSGPSGTGKTMAASVLAAARGLDLYVVDTGALTSKYVGETARNLQAVLARAERDGALLFFDECDGLFGRRTDVRDSHDRYLNADTNVLLRAVETYSGACLMATNRRDNIDNAFLRRLRYVIEFPRPDAALRRALWRRLIGTVAAPPEAEALNTLIDVLATTLDFTGAQIKNAVLTAAIDAAGETPKTLRTAHLIAGADHELMKEGRAFSAAERARLDAHV